MKRFFLISTLLFILILIAIGVLDYIGIIRIKWTPLVIIFTAVTPILKLISNWFSKPNKSVNQLKKIHFNNRIKLSSNQSTSMSSSNPMKIEIEAMNAEITGLRDQIKTLEESIKRKNHTF